ncbi:hypothetical protein CDO28_20120 (plasmid) [Sinorhizobium meliloti]|nr:hypothetical protein CDO28_20120 [Sinorhizobium meliloti]
MALRLLACVLRSSCLILAKSFSILDRIGGGEYAAGSQPGAGLADGRPDRRGAVRAEIVQHVDVAALELR